MFDLDGHNLGHSRTHFKSSLFGPSQETIQSFNQHASDISSILFGIVANLKKSRLVGEAFGILSDLTPER